MLHLQNKASPTSTDAPIRYRAREALGKRALTIRPYEQYHALQAARQRQKTETFKVAYARRAGVEGTMAQGVRSCGMRQSRYLGQPRTHLQHIGIAAALNVVRVTDWLAGIPVAKTRVPPFLKLMTKVA